jgi:hypothetical protein
MSKEATMKDRQCQCPTCGRVHRHLMFGAPPAVIAEELGMSKCRHPHLGLATTGELLDELRARIEVHALGGLDYRTVDGEKFAREAALPVELLPTGRKTG